MIGRGALALTLLALALCEPAGADDFKPAYFHVRQTGPDTYELLWKVPARDEQELLAVAPVLPQGTEDLSVRRVSYAAGASVMRWTVRVPGGFEGKAVEFTNLSRTRLDVLARYERADGSEQVARVLPVHPVFTLTASPGRLEVVTTYTRIGIEHILLGVDHLLFVLALLLIVSSTRRLLVTITAFTLAHSITLALATLDVVRIPGPPVEATIALSIVFVASEILRLRQGHQGLAARKPWIIAFAFGLLHGLGFAGALAEVGLPQHAIPLALLFFNVGVELGQICFVVVVLAFTFLAPKFTAGRAPLQWAKTALTYVIGAVASYWVLERVTAFAR
jgi:HupE / UreJ protein